MAFRQRFALGLAVRVGLLIVAALAFAASLQASDVAAVRIVAAVLVVGALASVWHHVDRTNRHVARFVEALRFGDMSARFGHSGGGGGFDELGAALDDAIAGLRANQGRQADDTRFFEAIVEEAPVAFLTIDPSDRVTPANRAARRLFADAAGARIDDYARYGGALAAMLGDHGDSRQQVVQLALPTGPQRAMVRSATVQRLGGLTRVIVVQPIQEALNDIEMAAQSDLIRVLTHEIMNSMTPVTSLARTAAELMADIDRGDDPLIADARAAIDTLARRTDGVMHFVESYRQISRPPRVRRQRFAAGPFADQLRRLFAADRPADQVAVALTVDPADLVIDADPDLLAQILLNLMRNGAEAALAAGTRPAIDIAMRAVRGGTWIDVIDNGPGIPDAIARDVFLPFFTTKATGTGVGLSFVRQAVLAHDGTIDFETPPVGGTRFRIRL